MKIYNVIWDDSHVDTTATPFTDMDTAILWAREQAVQACKFTEDFKEPTPPKGWLYYVIYSCEGDCLWITEHEIGVSNED